MLDIGADMGVQYPSYLYIRVDRALRASLVRRAQETGTTVSALARDCLRASVLPAAGVGDAGRKEARA